MRVPGGPFTLGAQATNPAAPHYDPDASPNEGPPQTVELAPFWIMQSEAPQAILVRCLDEGRCDPKTFVSDSPFANMREPSRVNHPINAVSWASARELCASLGGRLPTEAEWERAAAGTARQRFPWGDQPACGVPKKLSLEALSGFSMTATMALPPCENDGTVPLDAKSFANSVGVAGTSGNVAEWVEDLFHTYGEPPAAGETRRVQRGGGWMTRDPADLRTTVRVPADPTDAAVDVGFRCAWGPPPP